MHQIAWEVPSDEVGGMSKPVSRTPGVSHGACDAGMDIDVADGHGTGRVRAGRCFRAKDDIVAVPGERLCNWV
jgi:hypothetical protein